MDPGDPAGCGLPLAKATDIIGRDRSMLKRETSSPMVAIAGSFAPSRSGGHVRLDFLDVARGVAALLVMVEHGLHSSLPGYFEQSKSSIIIGQAAILVFFMISGFVIPLSLEEGRST